MSYSAADAMKRLEPSRQSLDDAYNPPDNFLELEVSDAQTHEVITGTAAKRFTDYKVTIRTTLPIFAIKEFSCRRRYSDFEWLREELRRSVQIHVPELPGKAILKQIPFVAQDDGIFDAEFIESRRSALESFLRCVAAHPLVQSERCLHFFLQRETIDRDKFVPGKITANRR